MDGVGLVIRRARWAAGLLLFLGASVRAQETVVLVHGILNKPFVMKALERALIKEGFAVINWGYASTEKTIEEYAADLKADLELRHTTGTLHFVGFSLGSIITRYYLAHTPPPNVGRFVQIAPPNRGSKWVDRLYTFKAFRWVFGTKAIEQLKDGSDFLKNCGVSACPLGIIVGGNGTEAGYNPVLEGDDDGSVALSSAVLPEAKDVVQVFAEHSLLLASPAVGRYTAAFLRTGKFPADARRPRQIASTITGGSK